jgi:hypothetical protein
MIQAFTTNFPPQNTAVVAQDRTVTTPWMAFFRDLYNRTGAGTGLVNQVGKPDASGNITTDWVSGTGLATLPALTSGQMIVYQDIGAGTLISPPVGATIDGNPNYNIPAGKMQIFWFFSATQIFSTQLG